MLSGTVAAIVVNRNGGDIVGRCLRSLQDSSSPPQSIVVVDNHSTDGSDMQIERLFPAARLLRTSRNIGYGAALNLGIEAAAGNGSDLLLLMNNDVEVAPDAIEALLRHWGTETGLLGPKVLRMDRRDHLEAAWGEIRFHHVVCHMVGEGAADSAEFSQTRSVDALLGCLLLTSRAVVQRAGPFDGNYFMYLEEIDYAHRVRKLGKSVLFVPEAVVWHAGGHATGRDAGRAVKTFYVRRNAVLFLRKHGDTARWCKFLLFSAASLAFYLLTFRWGGFLLRLRGYADGFRAALP